jgi:hypothetical protein
VPTKSNPVKVPVALIGFHIVQKTSKQGWIWSTFEHIANAPGTGKNNHGKSEGCYKPQPQTIYNLNSNPNDPQINQPAQSPYYWRDTFPYAVTTNSQLQSPSQITRQVCIPIYAHNLNTDWQGVLASEKNNSVLKNYRLIGVQWLETPTQPYTVSKIDGSSQLINTAIEPFANIEEKKLFSSSCIACHQSARLPNKEHSDFSFLMGKAH